MDVHKVGWEGMDWMSLAYDKDSWRARVNALMNLRFNRIQGISWQAEDLLASQDGICSRGGVSK